ncbi:MAG: hypothetical protein QM687_09575 [Ferruginibacter sp.]
MLQKLLLFMLLLPAVCRAQTGAIVFDPAVIEEKVGDLDGDGIAERAILLKTSDSTEDGQVRELQILKKKGRDWIVWKRSRSAILPSKAGGRYGDPFEYMEIEDGVLLIRQSGGNSWKWGQTDKYKYRKGELELISYHSIYGKTCEYWTNFDFEISSGKVNYKKQFEKCPSQTERTKNQCEKFKFRLKKKLTLENRYDEFVKVVSPRHKQEIYF